MKKQFILKSLLSLLLLIVGLNAWADTAIFDFTLTSTAEALGVEPSTTPSQGVSINDKSITVNTIGCTFSKNSGSDAVFFTKSDGTSYQVRIYNGNVITLSAPTGYNITAIAISGSSLGISYLSAGNGNYTAGAWSGESQSVVLSCVKSTPNINSITVTFSAAAAVATPTFSVAAGTYTSAQSVELSTTTEGASIYYTTNGDTPTNSSTQYSSAISVSSNTTIKAIAYKNGTASSIAEATYTIVDIDATTIMELRGKSDGVYYVKLTDAIVTYNSGNNAYMQDASGGIYIYASGHGLTGGTKINGIVRVTLDADYNGIAEITAIDASSATKSTASIPVTDVTIAQLNANIKQYESMKVRVSNALVKQTITSRNGTISQETNEIIVREGTSNCLNTSCMMNVNSIATIEGYPTKYNTTNQLMVWNKGSVVEKGIRVPVSSVGYATYYNSEKAYKVPANMEGYVAYMDGSTFKFEKAYNAGATVPKNTALVLKAAEGNYDLMFSTGGTAPANNALLGTDVATTPTADADSYFYGLSLNQANELSSVGFYWMNETGATFENGAHKAYLKLAKSLFPSPAKSFVFDDEDEATGINEVQGSMNKVSGKYLENGQIVIVKNGKKYNVNGQALSF